MGHMLTLNNGWQIFEQRGEWEHGTLKDLFSELTFEEGKGGAKRYENSSATLPQINALLPPRPLSLLHTHNFLCQLKLSEVEVYVEHLWEVKRDRSFPPLQNDLCPVESSNQIPPLQWTHSSGTFCRGETHARLHRRMHICLDKQPFPSL